MISGPVQFFTTGFGDWRRLLPAGPDRQFYIQIYPTGSRWSDLPTPRLEACRAWVESDFARADGDRLTPLIPILTQRDRDVLQPWFEALAGHTVAAVHGAWPALQRLAERCSDRWNWPAHVRTILILWSINMWVLRRLLRGALGRHPAHGATGRYFIWGEEVGRGPTYISGIHGLRGTAGYELCLIVSRVVERPRFKDFRRLYALISGVSAVDLLAGLLPHGTCVAALARQQSCNEALLRSWLAEQVQLRVVTADPPPQVRVPVFAPPAMEQIAPVCDGVAASIANWLVADTGLTALLERCSFAHCPRSSILCMLWHNSYYEATDCLIAQDLMLPFPPLAEGEWGVWLASHLYGRPGAARLG